MRVLTLILLLLIIFSTFASCAITHKYGPYYGKIIDAETNNPIEGAVVLVFFNTETVGLTVERSKFIDAVEVVTDKNGEFKIPSKRITTMRPLHWWNLHPQFRIFKPEYGCYPKHKDVKPMFIPNGTLPANQHVTLELPKLKTKEERLNNYGCYPPGLVPETKYKNLFHLIQQEARSLGLETRKEPK